MKQFAQIVYRRLRATSAFSPVRLFANGEVGAWYDPSDLTTLYQDAAGTTPVTALEQPVGRVLDKSGRGNHLSQSTSTARPVLSARVNQLTHTEAFDNASWVKTGLLAFGSGSTANAALAPDSTTTGDLITENTASSRHEVAQVASPALSGLTAYVFSFYAKEPPTNSRRYVQAFSNGTDGAWHANFDLNTGVVSGIGSSGTATITSVGNGWFRCVWNFTAAASPAGSVVYISLLNSGTAARAASYTGDGTSGIYIWGADLRPANAGVGLPAYQRVGAATAGSSTAAGNADYDTTGFPYYLRWDGTDDGMATGSIDFSGTDKMAVVAGARKLSDAAQGVLVELSTNALSNNGAFLISCPNAGGNTNYVIAVRGDSNAFYLPQTFAAPITNVVNVSYDISGAGIATEIVPRFNGTVTQTNPSGSAGTGNFGNYPLYVGSRGGSSLRFNGHIYGLVIVGRALTAAEISNMETWMNSKTNAYGPVTPNPLIWGSGNTLIWDTGNNITWGNS